MSDKKLLKQMYIEYINELKYELANGWIDKRDYRASKMTFEQFVKNINGK